MFKKLSVIALAGTMLMATAGNAFAYTVKPGDTMFNIAKENGMSLGELANLNPGVGNLDLIYPNQFIATSENEAGTVSKPVQSVSKSTPVKHKQTAKPVAVASNGSSAEAVLLAKLVQAEAGGESYVGKVAVAEVVLNRVRSGEFPNSVQGVIYQSGQFSPVSSGSINRSASNDCVKAVNQAMNGSNYTNGALYFYNPATASSRWLDSKSTKAVIGGHVFK